MGSVPKRLTGTCISHPLMTFSRDAEMAVPGCGQPATSRLLKNSFASGDEAGVIAVVDEDVPDEPPGGA